MQVAAVMRNSLILFLMLTSVEGFSQLLPGMARDEVIRNMSDSFGEFILVQPPNQTDLDFIKYEHVSGDMTLLVFLSEDGTCRFTRLMADLYYRDEIIAGHNEIYEPAGDRHWLARERGEIFGISMEESDWMITVTVRQPE